MYWKYLKSQLSHKWFVFVECYKLGIPWLGIIHDLSKFLPSEWIPYTRYFYGNYPVWKTIGAWGKYHYSGLTREYVECQFDIAWLHHQRRNRHHFQYWYLIQDDDPDKPIQIPARYLKEMLADWRGASRAYTGGDNTAQWWLDHKKRIESWMHPDSIQWLDNQIVAKEVDNETRQNSRDQK